MNMCRLVILALAAFAASASADAGTTCSDQYEVRFGVKPRDSTMRASAPKAFNVSLPTTMEAEAGGLLISLKLRRLDTNLLLAEFSYNAQGTLNSLLASVVMEKALPKAYAGEIEMADRRDKWALSIVPVCKAA